jgi:tRNA threonylcarbamoyladenosine biosynthesis protein TsaE
MIPFLVHDLTETDRFGGLLAERLPDGAVVALIGTLGAGKTRLVQAVAEASGVPKGVVASPTFVLLHEYDGKRPIYHFDAYRLADADEFRRLGPDDYFEGTGLTFVEWADKFPDVLPGERLEIRITVLDDETRRFELTGYGNRYAELLRSLSLD